MKPEERKQLKVIKLDFEKWSGFELEGENLDELKGEIERVVWILTCEATEHGDKFIRKVEQLFE
jgi:hypothetical protein